MGDKYEELVGRAIEGYLDIQCMTLDERKNWARSFQSNPPAIPYGAAWEFISVDGMAALQEFCRLWYANNPSIHQLLSAEAAQELCLWAFGEVLPQLGLLPDQAKPSDFLTEVLARLVTEKSTREHFFFPVRAFEAASASELTVGPVIFRRPALWLDQVEQLSGSPLKDKQRTLDLLRRRWKGALAESALLPPPFTREDLNADRYIRFVGPADWIASITIEGRDRSRSRKCAEAAVIVALDSLVLGLGDRSTARYLRGPGDDIYFGHHLSMSQIDGEMPHSLLRADYPWMAERGDLQTSFINKMADVRAAVGVALSAFVDVSFQEKNQKLKKRWVEAMYWFGQSRREENDFIAVVKIGITLDVLTQGRKSAGIRALFCQLTGWTEDQVVSSDGKTLKQFAKQVYEEGRSQLAHGGGFGLVTELPLAIGLADVITEQIVVSYVLCLARYQGGDNYDDFLASLPSLRPPPQNAAVDEPPIEAQAHRRSQDDDGEGRHFSGRRSRHRQ
jgi:hypothetical protein